ncbi:hydrogenase maturation nickel metallochaperone HypA [Roseibium aggregatum]|uniref:Hydrogenase maturation factor HypA n=1 Tax=Roseibium aggregatum TaxID=187304 RepID=A0A926S5I4_9HYPH|nr:hydrogenase maturation nickel metallochaperone HypA [Roseibium aggregatum]MBD1545467.1 hydrogenase maturation nickel metallochaperone HypA [Roseibium aggregatum]
MHEMSICESILGLLRDQAQAQDFSKVERVCLEIGPLSGVEIEALKFGFDVVMRDTLADGARLEIIETPGTAWCMPCGQSVAIEERFDACPLCGSHQLQVTGGEELRIKELEVN